MPLNENDLSFLIDITDCIADITEFTKGITFHEFERDKMRKLAVERQLEVIGQAANKISKETQSVLENIPWGNIIGLMKVFFGAVTNDCFSVSLETK